jgi:crotonobetainyl-CoA:carnitine CoA-transferase CaiB-like acyl-CoA transferase
LKASGRGEHGHFDGSEPHSRFYRCQDGQWVSVNAVQAKHWARFCETVGQPAWRERATDPTLVPDVTRVFEQHPGAYWEALMANHDACVFKVMTWDEHLAESTARVDLPKDPLLWAGFAAHPGLSPAPALGADTYAVLQSLGVSNKAFADYAQSGVVFAPSAETPNS